MDSLTDGQEFTVPTKVEITIVHPCYREMTIPDPPVIPQHTIHYLDEGVTELAWTLETIATQNTPFACGSRSATFIFSGPTEIVVDGRGVGATVNDNIYSIIDLVWPAD